MEADRWAALWQEAQQYQEPNFLTHPEVLEEFLPHAVVVAAESFPIRVGLGADNIAPRAITSLSEGAILALASLLMAFEQLGSWADALDLVLIVLLPRSDGGLGPIGLFPTIMPVWFRVRGDRVTGFKPNLTTASANQIT